MRRSLRAVAHGCLLAAMLVTPVLATTEGLATTGELDASRVGWTRLNYHASKFFVSINAEVELATMPRAMVDTVLITPDEGKGIAPIGPTEAISMSTDLLGRRTDIRLLFNGEQGASLQRSSHDSGKRYRHRIYRYTDIGAFQRTWWPVDKAEERLPADQYEQWSRYEHGMRPYPESAHGKIITEPAALLYMVGAARLDEPGDTFEILAYVRRQVHRVHIEVAGMESIKVDYKQTGGAQSGRHKGKVKALKLLMHGENMGDSDDEFELLGLRGNLELYLDPVTRAPLRIEGDAKIVGHAVMRLKRLQARNNQAGE